jgi:hypothetical protein
VIVGLSESSTITFSVVGLVIGLAIIALLRILIRKETPVWRRIRIGFFVERDHPGESDDS